ncbi:SDR family oxidoreductase [Gemmatimonas groenlandica]|uniref:SDR family oxidoreductase n=1 Tax=Gemmatimonas groenlandica TaxID=2732249 RepID=A0A6M4IZS2_9BACT|nr:SDR family oxidoreductase [Gemmatimonas groenlandica]QJR37701.1 SDR family oxidoreductase [Gemmatimonas groenlandica]
MTIAITGSTGQLGRLVIQQLVARNTGTQVVALARSLEKAADLGVAARVADYEQPDTLDAALAGVDTLLLISSNEIGKRASQHAAVVSAASRAGVKRLVYTSLLNADTSPIDLAEEHRATEAAIQASGIPFTILRNGWYTENYTGSIGGALAGGAIMGSAGDGRVSGATREDFAAAAVAVLLGTGHLGKTYELAGDHAFTLRELAAELSKQAGKDIPYRDLAAADYAAALAGFGVPEGIARAIAGWDVDASVGALYDNGEQLSRLIGRPTTPLSTAVAAALRDTR